MIGGCDDEFEPEHEFRIVDAVYGPPLFEKVSSYSQLFRS